MNLIEAYANLDNESKKTTKRLDEKIPRKLANAMKKANDWSITARRNGGGGSGYVDFENNEYKEITPEEAMKLKKQGQAGKIKALVNGQFVDFYDWGDVKNRSDWVRNSYGTLVKNAEKLYFVDDSKANADEKRAQRKKDNSLDVYGGTGWYGTTPVKATAQITGDTGEHKEIPSYAKSDERSLKRYEDKLSDLEKQWEDGDISRNEYNKKKEEIQSNIDYWKKEVADNDRRYKNHAYDHRYDADAERMQSRLNRFKEIKRYPAERDVERREKEVADAEISYNKKVSDKEREIARLQQEIERLKADKNNDYNYKYAVNRLETAKERLAQHKKDLADIKAGKWSVDNLKTESLRKNRKPLKEADEHDQYYARKKQRIEEFAHQIPFDGLFDYIKDLTGINDLSFDVEFKKDRWGQVYPMFHSQDLADRVGFLKLIFKTIEISSFNSKVSVDEPGWSNRDYSQDYPLSYWCTVSFRYTHPSGGSNGVTFMTAWYDEQKGWQFEVEKPREEWK